MDSAVIAAFIAAGFAVVTSVVNIVVSSVNAKKSCNIQVIVETRIAYMQKLREANATFIGIANPDIILQSTQLNDSFFVYHKEMAESVGVLKTLLKPFYPVENRLIKMIDSIEKNCLSLFKNEKDSILSDKIENEIAIYTNLFSQYDWVLWQFIMKQADGKFRNSNMDFDDVYEETKKGIIKNYKYEWI
jgi:hypothetical protein